MLRLSSNLTLVFKIFLPTVWTAFFGLFAVVIFFTNNSDKPLLASSVFRIGYITFFILFLLLMYFTIMRLKRVETDGIHVIVTNYFKTLRYPIGDVEKITTISIGIATIGFLYLKARGSFGKKISFLAKVNNLQSLRETTPHLFH